MDRGVEGRRSRVALQVGVGALVEQPHGEVEVAVQGRHEQRGTQVAAGDLVDVGSAVEQRLYDVVVALARGIVERSVAALPAYQLVVGHRRPGLPADGGPPGRPFLFLLAFVFLLFVVVLPGSVHRGVGDDVLAEERGEAGVTLSDEHAVFPGHGRIVDHMGLDRRIRAGSEQRAHHVGPAVGGGEHERGLPVGGFLRVHVGALVHQGHRDLRVARPGGVVERGFARLGGRFEVGARIRQQAHDAGMARPAGNHDGGEAAQPGGCLQVRARKDEDVGQLLLAVLGRPVQRGHAVALGRVHVRARAQQLAHLVGVAAHGGVGHR